MRLLQPGDAVVPPAHWNMTASTLNDQPGFRLQLCDMAADGGSESHAHSDEDQYFYVLDGCLELDDGETRLAAGAGEGILVPAGTPHGASAGTAAAARYLAITVPRA